MISDRRQFLKAAAATAALSAAPALGQARKGTNVAGTDVIVIGAGLAGLHAATLLEAEGARVTVLEGRSRVGGRIFTLDDVPGHPEGGGNGIGAGYARVLDAAKQAGVKTIPVRQRTETTQADTLINLGGTNISLKEWPTSPRNPFPADLRSKLPWEYQFGFYMKANPLQESDSWLDPKFAKYDISLYDFMRSQGQSEAAMDLALSTAMLYGTNPYDFSLLAMFHTLSWGAKQMSFGKEAYAVAGGNQRLPEAMAGKLKSSPRLGQTIAGIRNLNPGVEVVTTDGQVHRARHAIVTVPFSALRWVRFDPVLPQLQAEAIDLLGYTTAFQAHFVPTRPFWEQDGLPANMWTDGPAGRFAALRYGEDPNKITTFLAFVNGAQGERLDRMEPDRAAKEILDFLARVRPSTKGALQPVKAISWQRDPFAGAIYSAWKPGQVTRYAEHIAKPHGGIHFAGEHTAMLNRGMEGAMESGERAALEVLERL
jgi:monoamine oxidase